MYRKYKRIYNRQHGYSFRLWLASLVTGVVVMLLPVQPLLAQTASDQGNNKTIASTLDIDPDLPIDFNVDGGNIDYDLNKGIITIVGRLSLAQSGKKLNADKLKYYVNDKKLIAEGNVKFIAADGTVIYTDYFDATTTFDEAEIHKLFVVTPEKTYFKAQKGSREGGRYNKFDNGVYTSCELCRDKGDDQIVPWQIKSKEIVHDEKEKTITYYNSWFELFGLPVMYFPYLSVPDWTVKRKSGFLIPSYVFRDKLGSGFSVPYYQVLSPYADLTLTPTYFTNQGLLGKARLRHYLNSGQYSLTAAVIAQQKPEVFEESPGNTDNRFFLDSEGYFDINSMWSWGWRLTAISDETFSRDYPGLLNEDDVAVSNLHLTGLGERNYFDIRTQYFKVLRNNKIDNQNKQPIVVPQITYNYIAPQPVWGGEFRADLSAVYMVRKEEDLLSVNEVKFLRGVRGEHGRLSLDTNWRHTFITDNGIVIEPQLGLRFDLFSSGKAIEADDDNFGFSRKKGAFARIMPMGAVTVSWPWLIKSNEKIVQTIEPIIQIIARTNEKYIGNISNEDSQSLIFDPNALFTTNKFAGYDRIQGGVNANIGAKYSLQIANGGNVDLIFGRRFQISGKNSFAAVNPTRLGVDSGLETRNSDYFGEISFSPFILDALKLSAESQFDSKDFSLKKLLLSMQVSLQDYGNLQFGYQTSAKQPGLGIMDRRSEFIARGDLRLFDNFVASGGIVYDVNHKSWVSRQLGLGYIGDCMDFKLIYTQYSSRYTDKVINRSIGVQINLRSLTSAGTSFSLDNEK